MSPMADDADLPLSQRLRQEALHYYEKVVNATVSDRDAGSMCGSPPLPETTDASKTFSVTDDSE